MIPLKTDRLILGFPDSRDAAAVSEFVTVNRDHLGPYGPKHDECYYTTGFWNKELVRRRADAVARRAVQFYLREKTAPDGPVIGQCALTGIVGGVFQAAYLGFGLDRECQGHGYMYEALQAVIKYGFSELKLHRIMASYMPDNHRSAKVLTRLGFQKEGYAKKYLFLNGEWKDHVLTALLNDDWTNLIT